MFGGMSYGELLFFGAIALLLFGAKLPDVARNLGGTYRELRKNLTDFQREFNMDRFEPTTKKSSFLQQEEPPTTQQTSAPKFTPPPEEE